MATRNIQIREGFSLAFDHAAQYFTVSDPKFRKLVDKWVMEGAVKEWKGVLGTLQAGGEFSQLVDDVPRYVGVDGMGSLANHMVSQVSSPFVLSFITSDESMSLNPIGRGYEIVEFFLECALHRESLPAAVSISRNPPASNPFLAFWMRKHILPGLLYPYPHLGKSFCDCTLSCEQTW
jgi:hypothetical protein